MNVSVEGTSVKAFISSIFFMEDSTEASMTTSVEENSMKCSITSRKKFITSIKASMEAFVDVTSIEAFVEAFVDAPVEAASVEAFISFIPSMEAFTEASKKYSVELTSVKPSIADSTSVESSKSSISSMEALTEADGSSYECFRRRYFRTKILSYLP